MRSCGSYFHTTFTQFVKVCMGEIRLEDVVIIMENGGFRRTSSNQAVEPTYQQAG